MQERLARLEPTTRVLWLEEVPGYVPVEIAERYQRFPERFALHADGTLIYRDDSFQGKRVQLTPGETVQLLEKARATGILDHDRPASATDTVVLDAGGENLGFTDGTERRTIQADAPLRFLASVHADDPYYEAWSALAKLLRFYHHPRAVEYMP